MTPPREAARPPVAKRIPKEITVHGDRRIDDYFWLRERENPEVIAYLKAENDFTAAMMRHTEPLQKQLYAEMLGRIKETDMGVPVRDGDYFYYSRTEKGKQYPIYCRKKESLQAEEEVLLDQNALAGKHAYLQLGLFKVSPDHRLLAYSVDTSGAESYTIHFKDLQTGELLDEQISNTYYSAQWGNDNKTFFYTTLDEAKRPFKLHKHVLGTAVGTDMQVFHEPDERYYLSLSKSKSKKYLFLQLASKITTEVWYLDADGPGDDFRCIHPRQHHMEYYVAHHEDRFLILTNDEAINFKLMATDVKHPAKKHWREIIPHREDTLLERVEAFRQHIVVYQRVRGLEKIRILHVANQSEHTVSFDEPVYALGYGRNPDYHAETLRFRYSSLVTPDSVYDYHMRDKTRELKKRKEVLGGYDPAQYETERHFATAEDGTEIPISLVYKKGLPKNGDNPLLLYGYGSYGVTVDPAFNSNRLSLLDRGFAFAIAHIRGGGELGRSWYEHGKLLHKKNTFTDFIACAEHLITEKYTSKDKLVIYGGSAGGLLMGAVCNMRPELFKVAIAKVPFVDVLNTMLDASIPLTATEYEEWGDPHDKTYYDYIKSYSPYDNVERKDYPNLLITAGLNDPRVQYWEPAKWTAKLRAHKTDNRLLLLKTNMGAGHGGASGRYDYLKEIAFEYAFVLDILKTEQDL